MKTNPLKQGIVSEHTAGLGTVTRRMVQERAVELAIIAGRTASDASNSDWEQARRELTGEAVADDKEALLEAVPESERWEVVAGSTGSKVPAAASEDEDDEGRSDNARLVDEGLAEAEHAQRLQAIRAAAAKDQDR